MSTISEQIKELREIAENLYKHTPFSLKPALYRAADTIESLSAKLAMANAFLSDSCNGSDWIYCGDGKNLPKKESWYIVTYKIANSKEVSHEMYFDGKSWVDKDIEENFYVQPTILAWQPLPVPYNQKTGGK